MTIRKIVSAWFMGLFAGSVVGFNDVAQFENIMIEISNIMSLTTMDRGFVSIITKNSFDV
ncbi:MAG TPA: hypothetical protein VJ941_00025 [Gracilimonas sp.]|nr:hypothetical protein [Gracilimonas sp.]